MEDQVDEVTTEPKQKKKRRTGRVIGIVILVLFVGVILTAGWFGLVPGLSDLMGATKPRDLGVDYNEADLASYKQITGASYKNYEDAPNSPDNVGEKIFLTNPTKVENMSITQEELTAAINESGWLWMPITNAQVRLSENVVEVSGNLNMAVINDFTNDIGGVGYSQTDVETGISWISKIASNPAIYIKANVSVKNDQLSFSLQDINLGRITPPVDISSKVLSTGITNAINKAANFEVKSATFKDGSSLFSGTYPATRYIKK